MAIGADRSAVLWMVLRQGLLLALVGLGVGSFASMGIGRALAAAFPTGPAGRSDYVAFPVVAVTVLVVTLIAAFICRHGAPRGQSNRRLSQGYAGVGPAEAGHYIRDRP